jgi:hypothetical protein
MTMELKLEIVILYVISVFITPGLIWLMKIWLKKQIEGGIDYRIAIKIKEYEKKIEDRTDRKFQLDEIVLIFKKLEEYFKQNISDVKIKSEIDIMFTDVICKKRDFDVKHGEEFLSSTNKLFNFYNGIEFIYYFMRNKSEYHQLIQTLNKIKNHEVKSQ